MATATGEEEEGDTLSNKWITQSVNPSTSINIPKKQLFWKTERSNLLNISKLCIKNLIESALELAKVIGADHEPFQQFFVVIENVLRHGLKLKRNILGQRRDYWGPLEVIDRISPDASEITRSVKNLPGIKTNYGRGRAWVRLALMQKKLADYVRDLVENKEFLSEWYDNHALLMQEEGAVISGLLVGINVIDCNFDLKGDDLDTWSGVLDLGLYLKEGNYLEKTSITDDNKSSSENTTDLTVLIDQKTYLEEVNKNLSSTVSDLQAKVKGLQQNNQELTDEFENYKKTMETVANERDVLKTENDKMNQLSAKKIQLVQADIDVERETYNKSREGLNEMLDAAQKQLDLEMQLRKETERELEMVRMMKEESEVAMRLLEKDIHDKQDTLIVLRRQLDDIKKINLDLHGKLQSCEASGRQHMEKWSELEEKCARYANKIQEQERLLRASVEEKLEMSHKVEEIESKLADSESSRLALETNLKIEREWRMNLQEELHKEKEKVGAMQQTLNQYENLKKEYQALIERHAALKKIHCEQETALVEMGSHLSNSQLKVEEMKEVTKTIKDMKWTDDKEALICQLCEQPFSLSRRKHHCRNCGGIYCNTCSNNTMPLPSSAKPVRVCDTCHDTLLKRYQR
ncbi:RUN and FYVE domain-containing protein 2-like [Actinia tenebrosa]|uniref:RUN and FYVE domain-containing protein 2-like n=1 Tax=Actinia tenebrosa TaxID=6105 RepID=A0A6P8GYQ2_ACTTE|nr:RUN and FYVE domain-containing protein 2-like [Actinia tenebrosa]